MTDCESQELPEPVFALNGCPVSSDDVVAWLAQGDAEHRALSEKIKSVFRVFRFMYTPDGEILFGVGEREFCGVSVPTIEGLVTENLTTPVYHVLLKLYLTATIPMPPEIPKLYRNIANGNFLANQPTDRGMSRFSPIGEDIPFFGWPGVELGNDTN